MRQLSLDPALGSDPFGVYLFFEEVPFHHYTAVAQTLGLSCLGDSEEEALRDLALELRRWAGECVEQELDPNEPSMQWQERLLALRVLGQADVEDSVRFLHGLAGDPVRHPD